MILFCDFFNILNWKSLFNNERVLPENKCVMNIILC